MKNRNGSIMKLRMTCLHVVLVVALLMQMVFIPCAAQEMIILKGSETSEKNLKVGMDVDVVYLFGGKQTVAKGYVQSVRKDVFTVRDGWLKTIKYVDVITLQIKSEQIKPERKFKGKWVRVTTGTHPEKPVKGRLIKISANALTIHTSRSKVAIPLQDIANFDVSIGVKRKTIQGLGIGLLTGATITAIMMSNASPEEKFLGSDRDWALIIGLLFVTPPLCVIGAGIGFFKATHTWQSADVPNVSLSVQPMQNQGLGAKVSIALR